MTEETRQDSAKDRFCNRKNVIEVHPVIENGRKVYHATFVPKGSGITHEIQCTLCIPVIFIPGIMGSNLVDAHDKTNNIWDGSSKASLAKHWFWKGSIPRKQLLHPDRTKLKVDENLRETKGWGEPGQAFYLEFLEWLQKSLNDYHDYHDGGKEAGQRGCRYHMEDGDTGKILDPDLQERLLEAVAFEKSLAVDEVEHSYSFDFPVYACGYNWLDDNKNAAAFLLQRIRDVLKIETEINGSSDMLGKVILVTHSMGGLVARYCSERLGGQDSILGIVHGVMPATGAAAAYARMKTGNVTFSSLFAHPADWFSNHMTNQVLGATGADMSAVMSQAPGSLELLPFREYGRETGHGQWLRIREKEKGLSFHPATYDPFPDIYQASEWYGLFEEALVNPAGLEAKYRTERVQFKNILKDVRKFQNKLTNRYHPNSYVFYGKSSGSLYKSYGTVQWKEHCKPYVDDLSYYSAYGGNFINFSVPSDGVDRAGGVTKKKDVYHYYRIAEPDMEGDGTVPWISGAAPRGKAGVQCIRFIEADHQGAYDTEAGRLFTLWSIVRIVNHPDLVKVTSE